MNDIRLTAVIDDIIKAIELDSKPVPQGKLSESNS